MQNLKLIDSHFHLVNIAEHGLSPAESLSSIVSGIDIGTVYNDLEERYTLINSIKTESVVSQTQTGASKNNITFKTYQTYPVKRLYISGGMGPWETANATESELEKKFKEFTAYAEKYPIDFVGEFGFDFYHDYGNAELQSCLFTLNADYATKCNKKIIIHSRDANEETINAIKAHPALCGIIHCFSGDLGLMKTALDLGYKISYAGNVTYKSNHSLRETLRYVPKDSLLLETDSPYLAPIPYRGKPNTSLYIINTYECVSEVLGLSLEELSERVYANFIDFCKQ